MTAIAPRPVLESLLHKRSEYLRAWRSRYLVLTEDGILENYDRQGGELRGRFRVLDVRKADKQTKDQFVFWVVVEKADSLGRTMSAATERSLMTTDETMMNNWVSKIKALIPRSIESKKKANGEAAGPVVIPLAAPSDPGALLFAAPPPDAVDSCDVVSKLVLLGKGGVGKSSMLHRFAFSKFPDPTAHKSTIGVCFQRKVVPVDGVRLAIDIWDVAGQEHYRPLWRMYYLGAPCVFVVYDVTDYKSFEMCRDILEELKREANARSAVFIVGNKADAPDRVVTDQDGNGLAKEFGVKATVVSARSGAGVEDLLFDAVNTIFDLYRSQL